MEIKIPIKLPDNWYDKVAEKLIQRGDYMPVVKYQHCKHCSFLSSQDESKGDCSKMCLYVDKNFYCGFGVSILQTTVCALQITESEE